MTIKERLEADMKQALKARDAERLSCIRMLRSQLQTREVALRAEHGREYQITDEEALVAIAGYAKQRRDSIEAYRQGGREDLAAREQTELALVNEYLPKPLSEEEIRGIVREALAECGATSVKDLGTVMRLVMPRLTGAADGKLVTRIVRESLG